MILDADLRISDAQAVTASDIADNVVDLTTVRSIGIGRDMSVMFTIDVAAKQTAGDEDYTFQVEYSSDAAQTADRQIISSVAFESGTPTAPAKDADLLVPGYKLVIPIPPASLADVNQFIGVRYVTAGTGPTITVTADLIPTADIDFNVDYPNNFEIL